MKAFLLLTVGAVIIYIAFSGKGTEIGAILRESITGQNGTPTTNTP